MFLGNVEIRVKKGDDLMDQLKNAFAKRRNRDSLQAKYMDLKTNTYVELYYKGTIPLRVIFFSGKRGIMISEFEKM